MASKKSEMQEEIDEIRAEVKEFKPGNASNYPDRIKFPDHLFIGLFGRTGCGKTSLINSLKFAVSGRLRRTKWLQVATQEKAGGHTMYRKIANLTDSICVIDNRGLDDPNTARAITELQAQLDGERGYAQMVDWQEGKEDELNIPTKDLSTGHKISCAVFVFSALHDIDTNTTGLDEVVDFLHGHQGRYPVAVITHVDKDTENKVNNLEIVLRISGVSDIFKVANITHEKRTLEDEYQLNLLNLIERCMTDGDETLIFKHYQEKDRERQSEIERRRKEKEKNDEEERKRKQEEELREQRLRQDEEERRASMEKQKQLLEEQQDQIRRLQLEQIEGERQRRAYDEQQRAVLQQQMQDRERKFQAERERQLEREREREIRFQQELRDADNQKQAEILRIFEANKNQKDKGSCEVM